MSLYKKYNLAALLSRRLPHLNKFFFFLSSRVEKPSLGHSNVLQFPLLLLLIVHSAPPSHSHQEDQQREGRPITPVLQPPPSSSPRILFISLTAPSKAEYQPASLYPSSWNQLFHEQIIHYGII